jgi:sigma-B regulation protein RsbU (phosphoserine phosphatase)
MQHIACGTIWGGIRDESLDVCSRSLEASLYSSSAGGGRGGDVYFLSVCGADALTRIALADVAGHGEAVSEVSQWLLEGMAARMQQLDGHGILADLNRLALQRGIAAMTTAAVAAYDRDDSNVYVAYAGHPPILLQRRGAKEWEPVELGAPNAGSANLPLGVLADVRYDQRALPARAGDRLLLYSDGLLDARAPDGERFGEARLRSVLAARAAAGPMELKQGVLDAVREFSAGSLSHDDLTLIAVEIR